MKPAETRGRMFSGKALRAMIGPLFMEQLLVMLVGIADTLVISYAGEAAVSGVSLVNQFNTIFIYLFTALASGGAVIISQYIGRGDNLRAGEASSQLLMFSGMFSVVIAALVLIGNEWLLGMLFGSVEADVMDASIIYLRISAYSFPALAVYNAGAALYRSMGDTKTTMYISIIANVINVVGNIIGVFVLKAGVAGVAWPSLISRIFSAAAITALCFGKKLNVRYEIRQILSWNGGLLKNMLGIAIPNGMENGIFQFVKVALSSLVALFGTYQIAANGVAQSIWSLAALAGVAMGPVYITVIGQCMGSGDTGEAEHYFKYLNKITLLISIIWNAFILLLTPLFMKAYALEAETEQLVFILVVIHNVFNAFAFPFSGALSNGLRAAGDVRYTMIVSIASTIGGRLVLSYLMGVVFNMGIIGVALAMAADWTIRAVFFLLRQHSGKWKNFNVISG